MARPKHGTETPVRITTASAGAGVDISARQKRYVITMGIRTLCVMAIACLAITHAGPGWLPWVFIGGAVFLPYVAVVMANAANTKSDGFELRDGSSQERELTRGTDSE
jgi:arginine exporter protein ArgO